MSYLKVTDLATMPVQSHNSLLTEFWRDKVRNILLKLYPNNPLQIDKLLSDELAKAEKPMIRVRNLYKGLEWEQELDNILQEVNNNHLIIAANGGFFVNQTIHVSEAAEWLDENLTARKVVKRAELEAFERGELVESKKLGIGQNNIKRDVNSGYGVSVMKGFVLSFTDSASAITEQGRETIATVVWTFEKLMDGNIAIKNLNEFFAYINEIMDIPIPEEYFIKYNLVLPHIDDIKNHICSILEDSLVTDSVIRIIHSIVDNAKDDKVKLFNLYYRNNIYSFFDAHPHIKQEFKDIISTEVKFHSPIRGDMEKDDSKVFIGKLDELTEMFTDLLLAPLQTYDRVYKYINYPRDNAILSDTDSDIICIHRWVLYMLEGTPEEVVSENHLFRLINSISFIIGELANFMLRDMARNSYVLPEFRHRINVKNEFYFRSVVVYPHSKKNYSTLSMLREGKAKKEIDNTGRLLTSSDVNPIVRDTFEKILMEEIHLSSNINAMEISKRVYDLEQTIRRKLLIERDATFGVNTTYKSSKKPAPWRDSRIRPVELWNRLYPDLKIIRYNRIYVLPTKCETIKDLVLIEDPVMREQVRDLIFENPISPEYVSFGLRNIAIPENMKQFPAWLVPILNVNKLVESHMSPIVSLLPSVGLYRNRISSNSSTGSRMIEL